VLAQTNPQTSGLEPMFGRADVGNMTINTRVNQMQGNFWIPGRLPWPYPSHITSKNRYIPHANGVWFCQVNTPDGGFWFNLIPVRVDTATAANRLWDYVYLTNWGYTKVDPTASIDTSMNCQGYSTERNSWMSLAPPVVNIDVNGNIHPGDDYKPSDKFDELVEGAIFATTDWIYTPVYLTCGNNVFAVGSHSARIVEVDEELSVNPQGQEYRWIKVREKNRVSALYERSFVVAKHPNNPNVVQPIVLPWGTFSEFYVKKP